MKSRSRSVLPVLLGLVLTASAAIPTLAHHSFTAEFDVQKPITLKGNITKVDWVNPHIYVYIDVKDDNGTVTNWALENAPTRIAHEMGISKSLLEGQQNVTITAYRAKDGSKSLAFIRRITLSDGRYFELWRGDPSNYK